MNAKRFGLIVAMALIVSGFMFFAPTISQKYTPVMNTQAVYNETSGEWEGTYADVMDAFEGVFELFTDFGTLLGQNVGSSLSATIQVFIYSGMVLIPLAVVIGIVATAVVMVKASGRKFKK